MVQTFADKIVHILGILGDVLRCIIIRASLDDLRNILAFASLSEGSDGSIAGYGNERARHQVRRRCPAELAH